MSISIRDRPFRLLVGEKESVMVMKYAGLDLGTIEAVFNKLGGIEGAQKLLRGELTLTTVASLSPNLTVWKTLKLGTHKDVKTLKKALKDAGFRIGDWANDILGKPDFTVSPEETSIDLVQMSVAELGFKGNATFSDICAKAESLGLDLCPAEVGPQLRLQYADQPRGKWIVVAMKPITDSVGGLSVFLVAHGDDVRWLYTYVGHPDFVCNPGSRFVFARRK